MIEERARAKVNLTLHVTGQRDDGYHLLDSFVVFPSFGDVVQVETANDLSLRLEGPEAQGLAAEPDNLVLRAARLFDTSRGAKITLHKHLPVSSGIGGGSADAAAALRALSRLWDVPLPETDAALGLGADVPVCLREETVRMRGIGEQLEPLSALPEGMGLVLINARVPVSTPRIFQALDSKTNPPMPDEIPAFATAQELCGWLKEQRNDLETPAMAQQPVIARVLQALEGEEALLARMSGSGATCFGLYGAHDNARAVSGRLAEAHPDWWVTWAVLTP